MVKNRPDHSLPHSISSISPHERLWQYLESLKHNGTVFSRHYTIGPYVVDFYCTARKLVVELVDWPVEKPVRERFFEHMGLEVLYLDKQLVRRDLATALGIIHQSLHRNTWQ